MADNWAASSCPFNTFASFKIPAGKQIKKPRKKINITVPLGSLNLSDNTKYNKINIGGTNVINKVIIFKG